MYSSLSHEPSHSNWPSASAVNTSTNNGSAQSPSSNAAFGWVEHPAAQVNNTSQISQVSSMKNNQKQLTFHKGVRLYNDGCVTSVLQVGFNLSGVIVIKVSEIPTSNPRSRGINSGLNGNHSSNDASNHNHLQASTSNDMSHDNSESSLARSYRVSVSFDRCKITSVSCSCELQDIFWCEHVVALILYRIRNPETIDLRVPISETLLSLDRQQLQKLVQYIIAEHHTEVLPTAQRLLDEMRQSFSEINQIQGAPDPTAGACAEDEHIWHLDEHQVNEKVQNYLNSVCSSSKEAAKQINALFEKIREMFHARDSNGIRLLTLITQQFLAHATRNEKSRPLWDQLVSLWVVVMLDPDLSKAEKGNFVQLLSNWARAPKCPKEDIERRNNFKRKTTHLSDDEDSDEYSNMYCEDLASFGLSNTYPAHMATHRRNFQSNGNLPPVLRPFNQLSVPASGCPCQMSIPIAKKMRTSTHHHNDSFSHHSSRRLLPTSSNHGQAASRASSSSNQGEGRAVVQEPRSVFHRALDLKGSTWDNPHLQLILNKDGPIDYEHDKSRLIDFSGNPLWDEPISQAAARVETLKSHGYKEQALRLAVATVRRLKFLQDQWYMTEPASPRQESTNPCCGLDPSLHKALDAYSEAWIGHPFDPVNVLVDILLDASMTEGNNSTTSNNISSNNNNSCSLNSQGCICPYNQALVDITHRLLPDFTSFPYQHRIEGFPILPLVNLAPRRSLNTTNATSSDKGPYYHVPVPGCCHKDSYLTLALELALMALGQQRPVPTTATAHDRSVRQEAELIAKLESIDTSDPLLLEILKHQTTILVELDGGPFHTSCCGMAPDSAPLHTFAKYLFDSIAPHFPQFAYRVGVYALKMPLPSDENGENFGAARTSPRTINFNHLQSEQLALAQTMLSRAKDESQHGGFLRQVYRASIKNIRNPTSLLKLSKHALKEAKPNGTLVYQSLLKTSFDLGLQVLKITLSPHSSNSKARREAILFIVECSTDMGLESVFQVMKDARDHFSAIEALNLVVARDNDQVNMKSQAISKLKLKENPIREVELNRRARDLVLECANRDPANCALEALKFCESDLDSLDKALEVVTQAGTQGTMDSTQLIKVADYIHERGMTDKAFEVAMVAVEAISIPSNSDNTSSKKDIFSACEYAQKVNGFSSLIPKLIKNIECATVLSEIYHKFNVNSNLAPSYHYSDMYPGNMGYNKEYNDILNSINPALTPLVKQRFEDHRCWDALLKRTMKAFVETTRTRLRNISPRHYGEFIDFLVKAQGTFDKAPDGPQQFKDLIAEIIKSYRTKKKLMERLKHRFDFTYIGKI